jgi:hypothetical protein
MVVVGMVVVPAGGGTRRRVGAIGGEGRHGGHSKQWGADQQRSGGVGRSSYVISGDPIDTVG